MVKCEGSMKPAAEFGIMARLERLTWVAALGFALLAAFLLFSRPQQPQSHPRVPWRVLHSHYRLCARAHGEGVACGTGVAIGPRRVLTAWHVVQEGDSYEVDMFDEDGAEVRTIQLRLLASDPPNDLALMETIDGEDLPFYDELDMGSFDVGEWGYVVGAAQSTVPFNVYFGVFASKHGPRPCPTASQIATQVPPGQSGGGVYNARTHQLVGILVRSRDGFSLFVPARDVERFILAH